MAKKIKDKIEEKIENIVYKKAKEEIEFTARSYFKSLVDKVFSFFGWEETQEQKIERISKEIQDKKDVLLDDHVVGVLELFTMNYINAMGTIIGVDIAEEPELEPEPEPETEPETEPESESKPEELDEIEPESENESEKQE